jgi:NAD(P)-dependent dehydrogenase (short-subunit alcohol dehydrogenase family)
MSKRFNGKVIVITGASSGVGRACTRAFAQEGARLGLIARSREALDNAVKEARQAGGDAIALPLDITDADAVYAAADEIERHFGPIDIWVNNAMVTILAPVWDITPQEYHRITDVSYLGYVFGTQAALKSMRPRNNGTIVQVGSALEYRSIPLQSAYCAAKAAIRGFTDSLRTELIHEESAIRITSVQLPAVNTPQFDVMRTRMPNKPMPVPPIFEPEVIADAILWAAEHHPREMVVGASSLRAIIGQRFAPSLLDQFLGRKGVEAQLRDEPVDPDRQDNLFDSAPGDRGAHGSFSHQAESTSYHLAARMHARALSVVAVWLTVMITIVAGQLRQRTDNTS